MRVSTTIRSCATLALAGLIGTACAEGPSATAPAAPAGGSIALAASGGDEVFGQQISSFDGATTFTIAPGQATRAKFGGHRVQIPADVVCDPMTSGYGQSQWDKSCATLRAPLVITAQWGTLRSGDAFVKFTPDIRFAPSADPTKWAAVRLQSGKPLPKGQSYGVAWWQNGSPIDEGTTDVTQKSLKDPFDGVSRRVRHFSGYSITVGFAGEESEIIGLGLDW
jgi:hypothetical protein